MNTFFSSIQTHPSSNFSHSASAQSFGKTTNRYFQPTLLDDISNNRVKEMILNHRNLKEIIDDSLNLQAKRGQREEVQTNIAFLKQFEERKWLMKKGKKYLIDFDNQQRKEMKQYFNSLDQKKTGSIGIDELQELLLSVGLFETRQEIKALIDSVDQDRSGKIQFGQFLSMIQNDQGQNQEIVSFFKSVIGGSLRREAKNNQPKINLSKIKQAKHMPKSCITQILQKYPYPKGLSFEMVISHIRRKHMMTALNIGRRGRRLQSSNQYIGENSIQQISKGQRVMQALQKMYQRKLIRQIKESKRNSQLRSSQNSKLMKKSSSFNLLPSKISAN